MENATKALLIAGGVLLAIIIISLFVSMYQSVSGLQQAQDDKIEMQQIAAFNAQFEAYDKKLIYGSEVITVMKKAIDNNKRKYTTTEGYNFVNINIKVSSTFQSKVTVDSLDGSSKDFYGEAAKTEVENAGLGITLSGKTLQPGNTYHLGIWTEGKQELDENEDIIKWFTSFAEDTVEKKTTRYGEAVYHITSGIHEFKTHIFECTNVSYDKYGRLKEMTFEEK